MAGELNLVRFTPTLGGTTDWVFSAAIVGNQSPALAGAVNGRLYKVHSFSSDNTQWELSEGAYNSSTLTFARTTILYNSSGTGTATGQSGAGTKITFSTVPQCSVVLLKEDLLLIDEANSWTAAQKNRARANLSVPGRNRLINGDFTVDQRNSGASQSIAATGSAVYTVDRWYGRATGAAITGQRIAGTGSYRYSYRFIGAASNTAVIFGQRIIATNVADLVSKDIAVNVELSASNATTVTWTAYFPNVADTFTANTQIATGTITINSTPTDYSFTFNAGASVGNGLIIEFSIGALVASQTLTFGGDIQLEQGLAPTAFDYKFPQAVLTECWAYWRQIVQSGTVYTTLGVGGGSIYNDANQIGYVHPFYSITSAMRIAPAFTLVGTQGTDYGVVTSSGGIQTGFTFAFGVFGSLVATKTAHGLTASQTTVALTTSAGKLTLDAEV